MILKTIGVTNACFVTFLQPTSLCHDFFLLWSVLQNVTDIVMTNSGWSNIMSALRALLWWSELRLKQLVWPSHAWRHFVHSTLGQSLCLRVMMITDRKCHDQVSDQELGAKQIVTKHVIGPPTVWVSLLNVSVVYVGLTWASYQTWVLVIETSGIWQHFSQPE